MEKETIEQESKKETKTKEKNEEEAIVDEFKEELIHEREKRTKPMVWVLFVIILLIFGSLGVGAYQIFLKPEKIEEAQENQDKIQNRPAEEEAPKTEEKKEEPKQETAPVQNTTTTAPDYTEYTVAEGDTWSSIANEHGITSAKLMEYNGTSSEDLQIGQKIKIPK